MKRCYAAGLDIGINKPELMGVILEALQDHSDDVGDIARKIDAAAAAEVLDC